MKSSEWEEIFAERWAMIAPGGQDSIAEVEVKNALDIAGFNLPMYKVRDLIAELQSAGKINADRRIDKDEFREICRALKASDRTQDWKTENTMSDEVALKITGDGGGHHMIFLEEQRSFSNWVNANMGGMADLAHLMPLKDDGADLYSKIGDGLILCKLINFAVKDTIDERVINKGKGKKLSLFQKHENLTLAINSAKSIGCQVISVDSHILTAAADTGEKVGKHKHIVLGLMWQIIARFLFDNITLQNFPGLIALLRDGESIEDFMKLSPEEILLRWVNFQLERAGVDEQVTNFNKDIKDSKVYSHLLHQIAPKDANVHKRALSEQDLSKRAEMTLEQADKIDCREFVNAEDIVQGIEKLNLAFVANLFNNYPALEEPEEPIELEIVESREEKMYRNWMNSLGLSPHVNYLYGDLYDGQILLQIYDFIKPGIVKWAKINGTKEKPYSKMAARKTLEVTENCNCCIELGKKLSFVLVGIGGNDIKEGNKTLTLALLWQLMRAYTLALLSKLSPDGTPIVESEILSWANVRIQDVGKSSTIKSFADPLIKTAVPIIDLIDALKPGTINYGTVKNSQSLTSEECMSNAKYAVAMARKIGAPVYALPEDITEIKHKMIMTVYASLMHVDMS